MRTKIIVHYRPTNQDIIKVGSRAMLWNVLDHPSDAVSNTPGEAVYTSNVINIINDNGDSFETQNSIYQAVKAHHHP